MRLSTVITLVISGALGIAAATFAQVWLKGQVPIEKVVQLGPKTKVNTVVVAAQQLRFGAELTAANLSEVDWPTGAIPQGAFKTKADLLKAGDKRVVLSAIEAREPILKWKITGPGQKATLSALIKRGMTAVTIRVNDVVGVAGFVTPGDRVDVLLTRREKKSDSKDEKSFTDIILQDVRVLGVDQIADDRQEKPSVVKAVTIETSPENAQKVVLATTVGQLSLMLRRAGASGARLTKRITIDDLGRPSQLLAFAVTEPTEKQAEEQSPNRYGVVSVTRTLKTTEYSVRQE